MCRSNIRAQINMPENVSIKIENGSHLAVVGRNGSGKTTFIKLMCRLYDVTDGEILINGENIQAYTKESIINLYSVVFQDFKIFSVSLKDNVCASTALDTDRLYTCLENANIKERVERLPNKENTYLYKDLNEGGVEISGGEAQKLALARALYKDAPVVVLDDPTAGAGPDCGERDLQPLQFLCAKQNGHLHFASAVQLRLLRYHRRV